MEAVLSLRNNRAFGAELVIPMNAITLACDEMEYVDGGSIDGYYSAASASNLLGGLATAYTGLASGWGIAAAAP
jgi:hypothetical protein